MPPHPQMKASESCSTKEQLLMQQQIQIKFTARTDMRTSTKWHRKTKITNTAALTGELEVVPDIRSEKVSRKIRKYMSPFTIITIFAGEGRAYFLLKQLRVWWSE
jgi:hypothetical protein